MASKKPTPPMPGTLSGPAVPIDGLMRIPVNEIEMGERLRPIDEDWAERLGEIMQVEGQRTAIEVCQLPGQKSFKLVSGGHRLAAARLFMDLSPLKAELVGPEALDRKLGEISENIWRKELAPYDRAVFIAELVRTLKLKRGVDPDADGRTVSIQTRWQKALKEEAEDTNLTMTFVYGWTQEAADKLGYSKATIERSLTIYRRIPAVMIGHFRNRQHPILNKGSDLLKFAKLDEIEQKHVYGLLMHANAKHKEAPFDNVSEAIDASREKPKTSSEDKRLSTFIGTFQRMSLAEKKGAIPHIQSMLPKGWKLVETGK
jgi:hypothetical protein